MTLNGVIAVILRYFSEFRYLPGVLRKSSRSLSHLLMTSCIIMGGASTALERVKLDTSYLASRVNMVSTCLQVIIYPRVGLVRVTWPLSKFWNTCVSLERLKQRLFLIWYIVWMRRVKLTSWNLFSCSKTVREQEKPSLEVAPTIRLLTYSFPCRSAC